MSTMKRFLFVMSVALGIALIMFLAVDRIEFAAGPTYTPPQVSMEPIHESTSRITLQQVAAFNQAVEWVRTYPNITYDEIIAQLLANGYTSSEAIYAAEHCDLIK